MTSVRITALLLAVGCMQAHAQTAPPQGGVTLGTSIASDRLGSLRGGAATVNDMRLSGTTASNTAQNVQTGTNAIADGAFSHMSGIPVVIQNTGANVLIQNAVILNLQMQ
jgi:hypothetical protein